MTHTAAASAGHSDQVPRTGRQVFNELQRRARAQARQDGESASTEEYLTRHTLESFLHRLTVTGHARGFVLKGGLLLGAYDVRRPTKDVDCNAVSATVSDEWLTQVARDVAGADVDDGLAFDTESITVETIRDGDSYQGVRLRMRAQIGTARTAVTWDVSTGDPIVPPPRLVDLPRVLGEPLKMWSYAPETTVAEKAVTILERGITSTRWRDYVDILQLHRAGVLNHDDLRDAVRAVAAYRGVELRPISGEVVGYGEVGQAKWAAWRRRSNLLDVSEEQLDDQMRLIADFLDPIFSG